MSPMSRVDRRMSRTGRCVSSLIVSCLMLVGCAEPERAGVSFRVNPGRQVTGLTAFYWAEPAGDTQPQKTACQAEASSWSCTFDRSPVVDVGALNVILGETDARCENPQEEGTCVWPVQYRNQTRLDGTGGETELAWLDDGERVPPGELSLEWAAPTASGKAGIPVAEAFAAFLDPRSGITFSASVVDGRLEVGETCKLWDVQDDPDEVQAPEDHCECCFPVGFALEVELTLPDGLRLSLGPWEPVKNGPALEVPGSFDEDKDGSPVTEDCSDQDPTVYPGAADIPCDGIDQSCDGLDHRPDDDQDGYSCAEDCDDRASTIHVGAEEIPCDKLDQDCDGLDALEDKDHDGVSCDLDCNDQVPAMRPGAKEIPCNGVDEDCDGKDEVADQDTDGVACNKDCDDLNASIYPGAKGIPCDGIDQSCDGLDEIADQDQDGVSCEKDCNDGNGTISPLAKDLPCDGIDQDCSGSDLVVDEDGDTYDCRTDCNDLVFDIHPTVAEIACNSIDENCDGKDFRPDSDGDGYACEDDCDDTDSGIYRGAAETACDDIDQDCDGYDTKIDQDEDGWLCNKECNDADPSLHPGDEEVPADGVDNDCDRTIDECTDFKAVVGGQDHTLALCMDGTLWSWGGNQYGQLGRQTFGDADAIPGRVQGLPMITYLAAGAYFSLVVDVNGAVWGWGANWAGQLGNGSLDSSDVPVKNGRISNVRQVDAFPAGSYALALTGTGTVLSWGKSEGFGELGQGTFNVEPVLIPGAVTGLIDVGAISAGRHHAMALKKGRIYVWGSNAYNQYCSTKPSSPTPLDTGLYDVTAVEASEFESFFIKLSGELWGCGGNTYGMLGNGYGLPSSTPVRAGTLTGVQAVSASYKFVAAVADDETQSDKAIYTWGYNYYCALGRAGDGIQPSPMALVTHLLELPITFSVGTYHGLGIGARDDRTGLVTGWGYDFNGQVGDGSFSAQICDPVPAVVIDL